MTVKNSALRVLVIDDLDEVREQHRHVLRSQGITQVVEAGDGSEAIRILTDPANEFDLILCDLQMPKLDGIETIRALSYLGVHGAVALLSVEDEQILAGAGFLAEAHGLRFVGSIEKPLTSAKLIAALDRMREFTADEAGGPHAPAPTAHDVERGLDACEFTFLYHPQLEIESGRLYGVEALLRWRHPERGMLTADTFMSTVSASDALAARVTALVLERTVAFAAQWLEWGRREPVSMNVPGRSLELLEFPDRLSALVRDAGVPSEMLRVEVTEQELSADPMTILDVAARLRLKRFGVCIDQFGGSEFGLRHLQHAPITEVKVAREIVQGCSTSPLKQGVLDATIALGRRLGVTTIADGVRHRSDWDHLREAECDVGQGNYVVRALGPEMLEVWVGKWGTQ